MTEAEESKGLEGGGGIVVVQFQEEHSAGVELLQHECYPTLAAHEKINARQALEQARAFPQGQTVAIDVKENKVVGMNTGLLLDFDFEHPNHTFQEVTGNLLFSTHDPEGDYYYGGDICVHPDYRRKGIGSKLYESRKDVVRKLNRKGIIAGGMLTGFHKYADSMSVEDYVEKVVAGSLVDPTLTFQLKCGFEVKAVLKDYIEDASCRNCAALIFWEYPAFVKDKDKDKGKQQLK